jgi:hypothetical protein
LLEIDDSSWLIFLLFSDKPVTSSRCLSVNRISSSKSVFTSIPFDEKKTDAIDFDAEGVLREHTVVDGWYFTGVPWFHDETPGFHTGEKIEKLSPPLRRCVQSLHVVIVEAEGSIL